MDWDTIIASPHYAGKRLFPLTRDGGRYWAKRAGGDGRRLAALRAEARAMAAVGRRGVLVPDVVHVMDDGFVMSDLGETVQRYLESAGPEQRMRCVQQVADTLGDLHRQSGWHGNAALRNLMVSDGRIGMIDFEVAAHSWLSLNWRHTFDVWQVLHSLAQFEDRLPLMHAFLERYRPAPRVRSHLRLMAWGLSPLFVLLSPFRSHLKRDFRQGVYCLEMLLSWR